MLSAVVLLTLAAPLRIGVVFNLTGPYADTDGEGLRGVELAASELGPKVQLIVIDTQTDIKRSGLIVRAALRKQRLDALTGLFDSDYALPVGREAQRAKIPFVTSGATLPGLTRKIGDYGFMACYGDDDQARAMAHFVHTHLKVHSAAVAYDGRHVYTRTVGQVFGNAFRGLGGSLVPIGPRNPQGVGPALRQQAAEVLYAGYLPADSGDVVRRARQAGYAGYILSGDGFDTPDLVGKAGPDARGVFFSTHVAYDSPHPEVKHFVAAYRAKNGRAPESALAALSYDSLHLIANAWGRRGRGSLRDAIAATRNFHGVTGTISYGPNDREPNKPISIVEIIDGKPRFRELIAPR